jgi:hypothetical protein
MLFASLLLTFVALCDRGVKGGQLKLWISLVTFESQWLIWYSFVDKGRHWLLWKPQVVKESQWLPLKSIIGCYGNQYLLWNLLVSING